MPLAAFCRIEERLRRMIAELMVRAPMPLLTIDELSTLITDGTIEPAASRPAWTLWAMTVLKIETWPPSPAKTPEAFPVRLESAIITLTTGWPLVGLMTTPPAMLSWIELLRMLTLTVLPVVRAIE